MAPTPTFTSNRYRPIIVLLSLLILQRLLPSCATEIDVTADWKETTFVMALLRTDEQEHYIRIHKAFLDKERDAFVIASIQDSIYYKNLTVRVLKQRNNQTVETYLCESVDTALMEPGLFAHPDMLLYRFRSPGFLDSSFTYTLQITTPGGVVVTAPREPYDVNALYGGPIGGFGSEGVVSFALPPNTPLPPNYNGINWSAAPSQVKPRIPLNAKTFDLTLRVFYDEWNRFTVSPGDTPGLALKYVDWVAYPGQQVDNPAVVTPLFLRGNNLFAFMNSAIPATDSVNRRLRGTLFIFDFADQYLNNFLQINRPSSSLVDVRPTYTNVDNGLGLYAFRRSIPNRKEVESSAGYPYSSSFFRKALGGNGTDSLRIKYPQLNFVP